MKKVIENRETCAELCVFVALQYRFDREQRRTFIPKVAEELRGRADVVLRNQLLEGNQLLRI